MPEWCTSAWVPAADPGGHPGAMAPIGADRGRVAVMRLAPVAASPVGGISEAPDLEVWPHYLSDCGLRIVPCVSGLPDLDERAGPASMIDLERGVADLEALVEHPLQPPADAVTVLALADEDVRRERREA